MTLKELFERCNFNEIAPFIVKIYPEHKHMLPDYKMAFDILRNMTPEINSDHNIKDIEISLCRDEQDESEPYISVYSCEGDYWQSSLAKEIVVSDDLHLSDNEIAAHLLWSITFYGFSPDERDDIIDSLGKAEKRFPNQTVKIEGMIHRFTVDTKSFTRKELEYLFNTDMITERKYRSHSYDVSQRIEYLKDLIANYESDNFSDYTSFILMFRTSSDYPLDQSESKALKNLFNQHLPASANVRYGYGYDEKLGTDVGILLLGSK